MRILPWLLVLAACGGGGDDDDDDTCAAAPNAITVDQFTARFGRAVAAGPDVDGDGTPDVVVGEPSGDRTDEVGAVRLISGATGAVLRSWDAEAAGDMFGASVALGPDADGDGRGDVVVGAMRHDDARGKVYLFSSATGALLHSWDGAGTVAMLGFNVSLGPDTDGDGRGDVFATDQLYYDELVDGDVVHYRQGRGYLYNADGSVRLTFSQPDRDGGLFGTSAVLGPDADGDGRGDLVMSEPGAGRGGRVALHSGATGALLRAWTADTDSADLGAAATIGPDADGDGLADVAMSNTAISSRDRRVVLVSGATGAVLQTWADDNWYPLSGRRIAIAPDLDGDGRGDVLIGASMAIADGTIPSIETFAMSSADGAQLVSWSHAEHRYFRTDAVAAAGAGGCAPVIALGIIEDDPNAGPLAGRVELRRLP